MTSNINLGWTDGSEHLSPHQTRRLLARAKSGDRRAEELLVRHSEKRLYRAARRLECPMPLLDDLYQEGAIAVRNAIHTYESTLGLSWASYSYRLARCHMINVLRADRKRTNPCKAGSEIIDSLPTDEDGPEQAALRTDQATHLREHLSKLAPREQAVVNSYYGFDGLGLPLTAVANHIGVTYQCTQQIRNRALGKLYHSMTPGPGSVSVQTAKPAGRAA